MVNTCSFLQQEEHSNMSVEAINSLQSGVGKHVLLSSARIPGCWGSKWSPQSYVSLNQGPGNINIKRLDRGSRSTGKTEFLVSKSHVPLTTGTCFNTIILYFKPHAAQATEKAFCTSVLCSKWNQALVARKVNSAIHWISLIQWIQFMDSCIHFIRCIGFIRWRDSAIRLSCNRRQNQIETRLQTLKFKCWKF